ncbi:MAG: DOPA 4,5-dioxygenase family protein [Francisellaceae bacterium]
MQLIKEPVWHQQWHAHVYYELEELEVIKALVSAVTEEVDAVVGTFHTRSIGPHIKPMVLLKFEQRDLSLMIPVLLKKRLVHGSILLHPETDNFEQDHFINGLWIGNKLQLESDRSKWGGVR